MCALAVTMMRFGLTRLISFLISAAGLALVGVIGLMLLSPVAEARKGMDSEEDFPVFRWSAPSPQPPAVPRALPTFSAPPRLPPPLPVPTVEANPNVFAIVIGNADYRNDIPTLPYALSDARDMAALFRERMGVRPGNLIELNNATFGEMVAVLGDASGRKGKIGSWLTPGVSEVWVYFSGHGLPSADGGSGLLMPVDADPTIPEITAYSLDAMLSNLKRLGARSVTVIVEACFSGTSAAGPLIANAAPVMRIPQVGPSKEGITVLTAAQHEEVASWDRSVGGGIFTRKVIDGLKGKADLSATGNGDGAVTLGELDRFVSQEVSYQARLVHGRVQRPWFSGDRSMALLTLPEETTRLQ